ncbi:MAG: hypothetical protein SGJ20_11975 [Planctomycetota bacterium]|nr:hypothetical protein [Planctomycetota bacterium]
MKKFFALLVAVAVVAPVSIGCDKKEEGKKTTTETTKPDGTTTTTTDEHTKEIAK